jgi:hypothetical protein
VLSGEALVVVVKAYNTRSKKGDISYIQVIRSSMANNSVLPYACPTLGICNSSYTVVVQSSTVYATSIPLLLLHTSYLAAIHHCLCVNKLSSKRSFCHSFIGHLHHVSVRGRGLFASLSSTISALLVHGILQPMQQVLDCFTYQLDRT